MVSGGSPRQVRHLVHVRGLGLLVDVGPQEHVRVANRNPLRQGSSLEDIVHEPPAGIRLLLAGDLGCLMNMAGKLKREGSDIEARHVAEVLAGDTNEPAIAEGRK